MIKPFRLAFQIEPPMIIVEYMKNGDTKWYHHFIYLKDLIEQDLTAETIVCRIEPDHILYIGQEVVNRNQVTKLIQKLIVEREKKYCLPLADYNRASETQLAQAKQRMETVFSKNCLKPGDASYQYNVEVSFSEPTELSEWDED